METPLLVKENVVKIVLLSDLHGTIHGKDQTVLIDKIKQQNPDLILLTGDMFDDDDPFLGTPLLLSGICDIAPVYYVTGNHEYGSGHLPEIKKELESYGVVILSDNYVRVEVNNNEIIIAGIEDPAKRLFESSDYDQESIMEEQFRELDEITVYKIMLAHRPERISYYKKFSFNLVLSGHAHGGQVRIPPFINGLYAPQQGVFPKYAGGVYKHGTMIHVVSRGLSVHSNRPRIFNPPELVVIIIESSLQ